MSKVLIPLADGFEDVEAITAIDVLRRGGVEVVTASISGELSVRSAHGVRIQADALFADVASDSYEAMLLPGGGEGTERLRACGPVIERLRRQKEENRLICAICAAPLVLLEAGVLEEDQHLTCYPTCALEFENAAKDVPVVADGMLVTGEAPGSSLLFALVVLQTLEGDQVAHKVARGMVTDVL